MHMWVQHGTLCYPHLVHIPPLNDGVKSNIKLVQEVHNLVLFDGWMFCLMDVTGMDKTAIRDHK